MNPPLDQVQSISVALKPSSSDVIADLSVSCQDYPAVPVEGRSRDQKLGLWISNLLRYGVWLASITVFLGGILYLIRHGMEPVDYQIFHGEPAAFCNPSGIVDAVLSGRGRGMIQFGLLILIATPVLRVVLSLLFFISKRDFKYLLITSLVMSGLIYSLLGAYI
ncbi:MULTISPECIES: DUF1634 domain-containing protein [unclassified Leptolyngbya]|uniref:DUF1634 domain-containing protein n=1 Tax=unclassified Leptolyngbya TaxID=2650499 RepID=UPI001683D28E|nr:MULTISPECIES: DUF1634 domain-containing protein [unclassified Leptolyngbya]MBD1909889.1 DUF1634 domain-containing protein [Leptolyngbya sp. FACHB-8]MBD2158647.1 DUF1634 domain-containing protein [Leptolyngbya sp. FACHB-16]